MIDLSIRINHNNIPFILAQAAPRMDMVIRSLAHMGRSYSVLSIQRPSPGMRQTRYSPRRVVTAAKPGQPPNTDTGFLANSITVQPGKRDLQYDIAVGADYGPYLEFGTPRMGARPFMGPMAVWLNGQIETVAAPHVEALMNLGRI